MARRDPTPLRSLLPALLGRLAGTGGPAQALGPIWRELVGESIGRQASPLRMDGEHLVISVTSAVWARELSGREAELVARLRERMPALRLSALRFELGG